MFDVSKRTNSSLTVTTTSGSFTYPPGVLVERPRGIAEDSLNIHGKNYEITWARRVIRGITVTSGGISRSVDLSILPYNQLLIVDARSKNGISLPNHQNRQFCSQNCCPPQGCGAPMTWNGDPSLYDLAWGAPNLWYVGNEGGGCFFNFSCGGGSGTLLLVFPGRTCDYQFSSGFMSCNWNLINWIRAAYEPPAMNLLQLGTHTNVWFYMQCKPIKQTGALGAAQYSDPGAGFSTVGIAAYPANRYNSYSNPGTIFGIPGNIPKPTPPPSVITMTLQVYNNIIPVAANYIGWCQYSN